MVIADNFFIVLYDILLTDWIHHVLRPITCRRRSGVYRQRPVSSLAGKVFILYNIALLLLLTMDKSFATFVRNRGSRLTGMCVFAHI